MKRLITQTLNPGLNILRGLFSKLGSLLGSSVMGTEKGTIM